MNTTHTIALLASLSFVMLSFGRDLLADEPFLRRVASRLFQGLGLFFLVTAVGTVFLPAPLPVGTTPPEPANTPPLLSAAGITPLLALVVTIFTGFVLKICFDVIGQFRKDMAEEKSTREEHHWKIHRAARHTRFLELHIDHSGSERASNGHIPYTARFLRNLYSDPTMIQKREDLALDALIDDQRVRKLSGKLMSTDDWDYIRWLSRHFESPNEELQREIRASLDQLHRLRNH